MAGLLDRAQNDANSNAPVISALLDLGLVHLVEDPENPAQRKLDFGMLHAALQAYGPRVAAHSDSAAAGKSIWTPGTAAGGSTTPGGIWTPGASTSAGGERPKLIVPGR
jgi:hypothetical protein